MAKGTTLTALSDEVALALKREPERLVRIQRRLSKRLMIVMEKLDPESLPDAHWLETFKVYGSTQIRIMAEQRAVVELMAGRKPEGDLTDAQVEAELEKIALAGLKTLPEPKRRELLALARVGDKAIDAESEPKK